MKKVEPHQLLDKPKEPRKTTLYTAETKTEGNTTNKVGPLLSSTDGKAANYHRNTAYTAKQTKRTPALEGGGNQGT